MIEFGNTLRAAREAKGLSISQVAESTHMISSIVSDLENERFTKIVAPIYGRGFVKLYCEAVGLDPKPLIAEFMDIYNGNREMQIKERPISPAPQPTDPMPEPEAPAMPAYEPAPKATLRPVQPQKPRPAPIQPMEIAPEPELEPAPLSTPPPIADDLFSPPAHKPTPAPSPTATSVNNRISPASSTTSRYGTPFHDDEPRKRINLPPSVWRVTLLGAIAIGICWGLLVGIKALYRMTSTPATIVETKENVQPSAPVASEPAVAKEKAKAPVAKTPATTTKPAVKREPLKIPSLYID